MPRTRSGSRRLLKWIGNVLLVLLLVWTLVPFYWMIVTSPENIATTRALGYTMQGLKKP